MSTSSSKKILLRSSDGESFEVEEAVALQSQTIKHVVEDDCADNGIPLPNVTSRILSKVIEYCNRHSETASSDDGDLKAWDAEFVKVDRATLFLLILAANYLNIKTLLDLTCQTVADMIKGKTPEEIKNFFPELTPEQEEEAAVALQSHTIKHLVEDFCVHNGIPLFNLTSGILSKVIEYRNRHSETASSDDGDLKAWDAEFVKVDQATLLNLVLAANYLNIKTLLDLTCQTAADMIKEMTPEEIKNFFNIPELTPEEEKEVRRENQWAFEPPRSYDYIT